VNEGHCGAVCDCVCAPVQFVEFQIGLGQILQ
jgi:hypothetical protein